jgi:hypothetical protein
VLPIATRQDGYFYAPTTSVVDQDHDESQQVRSRPQAVDDTPPPTYTMARNLDRPEIAGLIIPRHNSRELRSAVSMTTAAVTNESSETRTINGNVSPLAALTSSNMASLDDIRYLDVARHVHMKSRISSVDQYPVALPTVSLKSPKRTSEEGDRQISSSSLTSTPISVASTSAVAVDQAVDQLPGAEPLDMVPPSQQVLDKPEGVASRPVTGVYAMLEEKNATWKTGKAVTIQIARNPPDTEPKENDTSVAATVAAIRRTSLVSSLSSATAGESSTSSPRRTSDKRSSSVSSKTTASARATSPLAIDVSRISLKKTNEMTRTSIKKTTEDNKTAVSEVEVAGPIVQPFHKYHGMFLDTSEAAGDNEPLSSPRPPMPPPKDPGYVSRPRPTAAPVIATYARFYQTSAPSANGQRIVPERSEFGLVGGVPYEQAEYQLPQPDHVNHLEKQRRQKQWVWKRFGKRGGGPVTGIKTFEKTTGIGSLRGASSSSSSSTEDGANGNEDTNSSNHGRFQLFSAWSRFIGKDVPKLAMLRES